MEKTKIGVYIETLRLKKGMSQRELAKESGVSHTEINRIEGGERKNLVYSCFYYNASLYICSKCLSALGKCCKYLFIYTFSRVFLKFSKKKCKNKFLCGG